MSAGTIQFLSTADVRRLHRDTIEKEGGPDGIRDLGLLESAVATPRQEMYGVALHVGFGAIAAAYLYHIVRNHPFVDGNKRAGALSALVFLFVNGADQLPDPDGLEQATVDVAAGTISKADLTRWMEAQIGRAGPGV